MTQIRIALISLYLFDSIALNIFKEQLKKVNGVEVWIINFKQNLANYCFSPTEKEYQILLNCLSELKIDLAAITFRSSFFQIAKIVSRRIKEKLNIPVIVGGIHSILSPEECAAIADLACFGEGEDVILDLIEEFTNKKEINKRVDNFCYYNGGEFIKNKLRPLIENLDSYPPEVSSDKRIYIDSNKIIRNYENQVTQYPVITSRGCPYKCSFCSVKNFRDLYKSKKAVRFRSPENVIDELIVAKRVFKKTSLILFYDDNITINKEWLIQFVELYRKKINLPVEMNTHVLFLDEERIKILSALKIKNLNIGVQSGSEWVRKNIYFRQETDMNILNIANLLNRYKITTCYQFIFDNPFEKTDDYAKSLDFVLKFPKPFIMVSFSLVNYPKMPLTNMLLKEGYISEKDIEGANEKGRHQIQYNPFYKNRTREVTAIITLMQLYQINFISAKMIRWLSNRRLFIRSSELVALLIGLYNSIKIYAFYAVLSSFKTFMIQEDLRRVGRAMINKFNLFLENFSLKNKGEK